MPFILIFVVLIVRPQGLFGRKDRGARLMARRRCVDPPRPVAAPVGALGGVAAARGRAASWRPLILPEFANQTLARIGVFAVAVLGLNVVMGYTGQVSLGQIFFLGLGAYVTAYGVTQRLEHRPGLRRSPA